MKIENTSFFHDIVKNMQYIIGISCKFEKPGNKNEKNYGKRHT